VKKLILPGFVLFAAFLAVMAFNYPAGSATNNCVKPPQEKVEPVFPENVEKILKLSCFDCHGDASSNAKALGKVNFSKWNDLTRAQKVGKMQDMIDVLQKGEMPPAKYLTNYPDHAPGQEQKDTLIKWANDETDKLMGN
jgi:hypothetical protein